MFDKKNDAFTSGFFANGVVVEIRTITSQKNKDWSMQVLKLAELGKSFEIEVPEGFDLKGIDSGDHLHIQAKVDFRNNALKFVLTKVERYTDYINAQTKPAKAS